MIGICEKCGNYGWDKEVEGDKITCPRCGNSWKFKKLPLFILTGCSGIGKTTTAQHIQKGCQDIVTLDADMFYNLMPSETDQNWIQGSVDYNNYFRTHNSLGDISFETLDTEGKSVSVVEEVVKKWMFSKL